MTLRQRLLSDLFAAQSAVFIPDFGGDRVLDRRTTRAEKMVKDRCFERLADLIASRSLPAFGACYGAAHVHSSADWQCEHNWCDRRAEASCGSRRDFLSPRCPVYRGSGPGYELASRDRPLNR
jgi:hypothetical protein